MIYHYRNRPARSIKTAAFFLALALLLTGCGGRAAENSPPAAKDTDMPLSAQSEKPVARVITEDEASTPPDDDAVDGLAKSLEESGFTVEITETGPELLRGKPYLLTLGGAADAHITVYLYADTARAREDASCIDASGAIIHMSEQTHYITWKSVPHFYCRDNLIIQYIGTDDTVLRLLAGQCGDPFAGGDQ